MNAGMMGQRCMKKAVIIFAGIMLLIVHGSAFQRYIRPYSGRHSGRQPGMSRYHRFRPPPPPDPNRAIPCCRDASGTGACKALIAGDPRSFADRCANEPDFSLVSCCKSCDQFGVPYRNRAASFFAERNNSNHCFDRMSTAFCGRFVDASDVWQGRRWSCDAEHARLAFRVCRESCGFCELDWKKAVYVQRCNFT